MFLEPYVWKTRFSWEHGRCLAIAAFRAWGFGLGRLMTLRPTVASLKRRREKKRRIETQHNLEYATKIQSVCSRRRCYAKAQSELHHLHQLKLLCESQLRIYAANFAWSGHALVLLNINKCVLSEADNSFIFSSIQWLKHHHHTFCNCCKENLVTFRSLCLLAQQGRCQFSVWPYISKSTRIR